MKFEENKILAPLTTMRVGGPTRFFSVVQNEKELVSAIFLAEKKELPYFLLGEGSNIIISDEGFDGFVIKLFSRKISFEDYPGGTLLVAEAGVHWDDLVKSAVEKKLHGVENLSFIPGTVGAAPVQNIGAYGVELSSILEWVEVLDSESKKTFRLTKSECGFGYRDSIFKKNDGSPLVITRIALILKKDAPLIIDYKDVREYLITRNIMRPNIELVRDAIIAIRKTKLPDPTQIGTVGSFFKNPRITREHYKKLQKKYPDLPGFSLRNGYVKVSLAWILDHVCKLKGIRKGDIGTYNSQPLAIVNFGNGSACEIKKFAEEISHSVKEKTDIMPEYEISFIGNWKKC